MGSPLNGLTTRDPVNTPRLSRVRSDDSRSISLAWPVSATKASTASRCSSVVRSGTSGCSGATTA